MRLRSYQRPYLEPPDADEARRSAIALAKFALASGELTDRHRRRLLREAVWWATEIGGKCTSRYRSAAALAVDQPDWWRVLRHEHVNTRSSLVDEILENPDLVEEILTAKAIACVVTAEEHVRLTEHDGRLAGWERYAAARIDVYDMTANEPVVAGGKILVAG